MQKHTNNLFPNGLYISYKFIWKTSTIFITYLGIIGPAISPIPPPPLSDLIEEAPSPFNERCPKTHYFNLIGPPVYIKTLHSVKVEPISLENLEN